MLTRFTLDKDIVNTITEPSRTIENVVPHVYRLAGQVCVSAKGVPLGTLETVRVLVYYANYTGTQVKRMETYSGTSTVYI